MTHLALGGSALGRQNPPQFYSVGLMNFKLSQTTRTLLVPTTTDTLNNTTEPCRVFIEVPVLSVVLKDKNKNAFIYPTLGEFQ